MYKYSRGIHVHDTRTLYDNGYSSIVHDTKTTKQTYKQKTGKLSKCPSIADKWNQLTTTTCKDTDEPHDISKKTKQNV